MKSILAPLLILLAAAPLAHAQRPRVQARETIYDARLRPLVPLLKRGAEVPLRLPRSLRPFQTPPETQLYLSVGDAGAGGYAVRIENSEDCNGANYCFVGSISGQARTEENKALLDAIVAEGRAVRLRNGIRGHYFEGPCGASCVPDSLMWRQGGFYYIVTATGLGVGRMLQVANSMAAARPINP